MKHRNLPRTAAALLVGASLTLWGCAAGTSPGTGSASPPARDALVQGFELYEAGELHLAGRRFARAASLAASQRDHELALRASAAECTTWLRAQALAELSECTLRLERFQRRTRRPDPAINTLIAMGAIAGDRALPPLRLPDAVRPLIEAAAQERE